MKFSEAGVATLDRGVATLVEWRFGGVTDSDGLAQLPAQEVLETTPKVDSVWVLFPKLGDGLRPPYAPRCWGYESGGEPVSLLPPVQQPGLVSHLQDY